MKEVRAVESHDYQRHQKLLSHLGVLGNILFNKMSRRCLLKDRPEDLEF